MQTSINSAAAGVNFSQLENLMEKNGREAQRSLEAKAKQHHLQAQNALKTEVNELRDQNKNRFRSALFSMFMKIAQFAANFIPTAGPIVSKVMDILSHTLKPFQWKANDAELKAKEASLRAQTESSRGQNLEKDANRLQENREVERNRLEKALANLQDSQTTAVRV